MSLMTLKLTQKTDETFAAAQFVANIVDILGTQTHSKSLFRTFQSKVWPVAAVPTAYQIHPTRNYRNILISERII